MFNKKYLMLDYDDIEKTDDGYRVSVRNGEYLIHVGDEIGHCVVAQIEAYGKRLAELSPGMTGMITLRGKSLGAMIVESPKI
jgi:hypothetical protein